MTTTTDTAPRVSGPRFRQSWLGDMDGLRRALKTYGADLPADLESALDRVDDVDRLVAATSTDTFDLAEQLVAADDFDAALVGVAAEITRRDAIARLRVNLANAARDRARVAVRAATPAIVASVGDGLAKDAALVAKSAPHLPPSDALDPSAVLAHAGAADAWAAIDAPLSRMAAIVAALPVSAPSNPGTLNDGPARLAYLVDVPDVSAYLMGVGPFDEVKDDDPVRRNVKSFVTLAERDARLALVEVGRSTFEGLSLAPAREVDEYVRRASSLAASQTVERKREGSLPR